MELQARNPGTTVKIDVYSEDNSSSESRMFKRIYVFLDALKKGFKAGCWDFLGLDGTFMKGPFPGQILTAVGLDSNNGIYPVAYAVVEAETTNSWTWFLECLGDDLDLNISSNFTCVTDRQVTGQLLDQYVVNLIDRTCTCRNWDITGIPCQHAISAMYDKMVNGENCGDPEDWVNKCYWLSTWIEMYQHKIDPINGRNMWRRSSCPTTLLPPKHHKQVGRPKKKRKKAAGEVSKGKSLSRKYLTVTCSKCHNKGHNTRSCKGQGGADEVARASMKTKRAEKA